MSGIARSRSAQQPRPWWLPRRSERAACLFLAFALVNVLGLAWEAVTGTAGNGEPNTLVIGGRRQLLKKEFTSQERVRRRQQGDVEAATSTTRAGTCHQRPAEMVTDLALLRSSWGFSTRLGSSTAS